MVLPHSVPLVHNLELTSVNHGEKTLTSITHLIESHYILICGPGIFYIQHF